MQILLFCQAQKCATACAGDTGTENIRTKSRLSLHADGRSAQTANRTQSDPIDSLWGFFSLFLFHIELKFKSISQILKVFIRKLLFLVLILLVAITLEKYLDFWEK